MIQKFLFVLLNFVVILFGLFFYIRNVENRIITPAKGLDLIGSLNKQQIVTAEPTESAKPTITPPIPREELKHGYSSGPTINIKNENYFVTGNDRSNLCDQIDSGDRQLKNGKVELGHIKFDLSYKYIPIRNKQGFTVGDFTVTTNSVISVPQWASSAGASDDLKKDWRSFKESVATHENTHQKILVEYANKFVTTMNNLGYFTTAESLDEQINKEYDSMYAKMDKAQDDFDKNSKSTFSHFCNND